MDGIGSVGPVATTSSTVSSSSSSNWNYLTLVATGLELGLGLGLGLGGWATNKGKIQLEGDLKGDVRKGWQRGGDDDDDCGLQLVSSTIILPPIDTIPSHYCLIQTRSIIHVGLRRGDLEHPRKQGRRQKL